MRVEIEELRGKLGKEVRALEQKKAVFLGQTKYADAVRRIASREFDETDSASAATKRTSPAPPNSKDPYEKGDVC